MNHAWSVMHGEKSPTFTVDVTDNHIKTAKLRNATKCMEVFAIIEAVEKSLGPGRCLYVRVDSKGIVFSDPVADRRYRYFHSNKTLSNFLRWDRGEDIKPFSFQLRDGQVLHRGWRATHGPEFVPKKGRSSRGKGNKTRVPMALRTWGACLYVPKEALAARHRKAGKKKS